MSIFNSDLEEEARIGCAKKRIIDDVRRVPQGKLNRFAVQPNLCDVVFENCCNGKAGVAVGGGTGVTTEEIFPELACCWSQHRARDIIECISL